MKSITIIVFLLCSLSANCQRGIRIVIGNSSSNVSVSNQIDSSSIRNLQDSIHSLRNYVDSINYDKGNLALKDSIDVLKSQILSVLAETRLSNANIVIDGNSLTSTSVQFGGTPFPTQMKGIEPFKNNNSTIRSYGVGGQNIDEMSSDAAAQIDTSISSNKRNILIVWEITNQLALTKNPRTVINKLWSYCDARKSAGWTVIVLTSLPRNSDLGSSYTLSTYNSDLLTANGYVMSEYSAHAKAYIDVRSEPCLSNYSNSCFANDGVHLSNSGYLAIANLIKYKLIEICNN